MGTADQHDTQTDADTCDHLLQQTRGTVFGAPPQSFTRRYQVRARLGGGTAGEVFAARDLILGDDVAVKVVDASKPDDARRLRRELVALRGARLPGVVALRDAGPIGNKYFIVMDLVDGKDFPGAPRLHSWDELAPLATRLLEVLAGLHDAGFVHCDLKPANVKVVHGDGVDDAADIVVLDLGLALGRAGLSASRVEGYTPAYAPPEILRSPRPRPSLDLYAVGVMLHEALAGALPRGGRCTLPAGVPHDVGECIARMVSPRPSQRPSTVREVLAVLGQARRPPLLGVDIAARSEESDLRDIFWGPDHFLHLRSDGARALWQRTGGHGPAVERYLHGWVQAGLARVENGRVRLQRPGVARLLAGERVGPEPEPYEGPDALVQRAFALACPDGSVALVAAALCEEPDDIAAAVARLASLGQVWPLGDGRWGAAPLRPKASGPTVPLQESLAAALPPDHPARVRLLAPTATDPAALADICEHILARPDLDPGAALAAIEPALLLARAREHSPTEARLLLHLAAWSMHSEEPQTLELALYALGRAEPYSVAIQAAEALVFEHLRIRRHQPDERARPLPHQAHPDLDTWRVALELHRLDAKGPEERELFLDKHQAWAGDDPVRQAHLDGWRGRLRYLQGRMAEAAALHEAAAARKVRLAAVTSSLRGAASAWLDADDPVESAKVAQQTVDLARRLRLPRYEALATWCLRSALARAGQPPKPDPELARAARALDLAAGAQVTLGEAILAWRHQQLGLAADLASRAATFYAGLGPGLRAARVLAQLVGQLSGPIEPLQARALCQDARALRPAGIRVQVLGLLGQALGDAALIQEARSIAENELAHRLQAPLELTTVARAAGLPSTHPD